MTENSILVLFSAKPGAEVHIQFNGEVIDRRCLPLPRIRIPSINDGCDLPIHHELMGDLLEDTLWMVNRIIDPFLFLRELKLQPQKAVTEDGKILHGISEFVKYPKYWRTREMVTHELGELDIIIYKLITI